ncbi:MAG: ATP-binding protein [Treponema sp.]|nr:ATP-binding protein [Treponema sp.]
MHFTLADLITDITQNAVEAESDTVELQICECSLKKDTSIDDAASRSREFRFLVKDNGKGMTKEEVNRAIDPFVTDGIKHPNRKVGLGLPFLVQMAEQSNGGWDIKSEKGKGTVVKAWFDSENVDTPPVGDLPGMFRTILTFNTQAEIIIRRLKEKDGDKEEYELRKSELTEALGSLEEAGSLVLLDQYLRSLENEE